MPDSYALSSYAEDGLLAHLMGQSVFALPSVYAALVTTTISEDDAGDEIVELAGAYARLPISPSSWSERSDGSMELLQPMGFAPATVGQQVVGFALVDSDVDGNILAFYNFGSPINVGLGEVVTIHARSLVLQFSNGSCLTNDCRIKLLRLLVGRGTFSIPERFIALVGSVPGRTSTGGSIIEPSGNNYARIAALPSEWTSPAFGVTVNESPFVFGPATPAGWFTHSSPARAVAMVDAAIGGGLWAWMTMNVPAAIGVDQALTFDASRLSLALR